MNPLTKYALTLLAVAALVLLPVAAAAQQAQPLTITNGPVVEYVGPHSAEIAWTTSTGGSSIIRYGTNPNALSQTAESPYDKAAGAGQHVTHRVKIQNLQPSTTYYFIVESGQGQGTGTGVQAPVSQFTTKAK